ARLRGPVEQLCRCHQPRIALRLLQPALEFGLRDRGELLPVGGLITRDTQRLERRQNVLTRRRFPRPALALSHSSSSVTGPPRAPASRSPPSILVTSAT